MRAFGNTSCHQVSICLVRSVGSLLGEVRVEAISLEFAQVELIFDRCKVSSFIRQLEHKDSCRVEKRMRAFSQVLIEQHNCVSEVESGITTRLRYLRLSNEVHF